MGNATTNFPKEAAAAVREFRRITREFHVLQPPQAPTKLSARKTAAGEVTLEWVGGHGEGRFEIERTQRNGTEFEHLGDKDVEHAGQGKYGLVDTGLVTGKYYYRVRSVNRRAESGYATVEIDVVVTEAGEVNHV